MAANYFDQFDPSTAKPVDGGNFFDQFDPSTAKPEPKRTLAGTAGDLGVVALKGAVGLPQAAVGLLDIPTGGHVGRALEGAGVRFKDAQDTLDTMYSPAQQAANRKVREAEGFVGTARAMLENPSTIATGVGESLPQMLGGAGVARGLLAAVPKIGAIAAGALGEGVMGAGSAAEQIREQTPDGLLTGKQAALAGASGTATAALGGLGGKVAQRLGVGDVDTMLASGAARAAGPGSTRSMPRQIAEGAVAEGVLEEMPQSMAEQALQNVALDKPVGEGVGAAAAQGLITGAAMGGVGGGIGASGNRAQQRAQEQATQAAEAPTQAPAGAETLDAAPPAMEPAAAQPDTPPGAQDQNEPGAPDAAPPTEGPVTPEQRIAQLEERLSFIQQQAKGNGWDQRLIAARDEATQELEALRGPAPEPAPEPVPDAAPQVPLSAQMGIDPTAGPLSRSAAIAVDSGASQQLQEAQFLGATGRDLQVRRSGPGVTDESNVIDVQGRVVEERAIATPRRLTTQQGGDAVQPASSRLALPGPAGTAIESARQSGAQAFADGVPRAQIVAIPNVVKRAQQLRGYDEAARAGAAPNEADLPQSSPNAPATQQTLQQAAAQSWQGQAATQSVAQLAPIHPNKPNGVPHGREATQTQPRSAQPAQGTGAQAAAMAEPGMAGGNGAGGAGGTQAPAGAPAVGALSHGPATANAGAQGTPAAGAQGTAQDATALRQQLSEVEAKIIERAQNGGGVAATGGIDAAMKSPVVPVTLKAQRKRLHDQVQQQSKPLGLSAKGWQPETGDAGNTIWTKKRGRDIYTATLNPATGTMEVTALVGVVDTQIASFRVESPEQAAQLAEQAVARDVAETKASKQGKAPASQVPVKQETRASAVGAVAQDDSSQERAAAPKPGARGAVQPSSTSLADLHEANGPYPPSAATRTDDGRWQPAVKVGQGGRPIEGAPTFSDASSAAAWAGYEQAKARDGADVAGLRQLQEAIPDGQKTTGAADAATPRNLRLGDDRAPGAGAPAQDGAGRPDTGSAPAVGAGQRAGGDTAQPARAVRAAVPDAGGAGQQAAGVERLQDGRSSGAGAAEQDGPSATRPSARIEDFGEELKGARKMLYAEAYADGMAKAKELDTKAHPLSKTWPEPDYAKLLEGGAPLQAVSLARALREAVPTKPQSAWKLKGWADKMQSLRSFAEDVLSGRADTEEVGQQLRRAGILNVADKAALYEAMGHDRSLKGLDLSAGSYSMYDSVRYDPPRTIWTVSREAKGSAFGNWPRELAKGDTREEAIAAFKKRAAELLAEEQAPAKGATFEIYSKRAGGAREFFIGKKIGRNVAELKAGFADVKAARQYLADHQTELEGLLEKYKAVPPVRNAQNAPRIGQDYRKGADVTPEQFQETFGFRGVQFGNYVEGNRRQQDLNQAYDGLMDLAGVLNLPPRALSLGGRLGLAFGARGSGGVDAAAAHYERGEVVINLTKKQGAGSLAHEWWHALDNYFSRERGDGRGMMTEDSRRGEGVREEMRAAFREVIAAINRTGMQERSRKLDDRRTKEYWTTKPEMSARAFESYVIAKLQDQNGGNDYLANVVGDAVFALEGAYPYPTAGELPQIRGAFDAFFQTVETRQGDSGDTVLFSRSPATQSTYDARIDALFAGEKPRLQGARVLDRSDVLAFLGLGDGPVNLAEGKVIAGHDSHPHMTASVWKKIPQWLENPALVFDSDTTPGRLVFIAPELVNGSPVRIVVEPNAGGGVNAHLLVNAYDAQGGSFRRWEQDGLLRYVDRNKYAHVSGTFQPRLAGLPGDRGRNRILTDKQYNGWRNANNPAYSFAGEQAATAKARTAALRVSDERLVATQQLVDGLKERWSSAPEIIVARNMEDAQIPQHVRDYDSKLKSQGATGEPQGFILGGKVYLLADTLQGPNHIATVLFHEVLGHYGLRRAFGDTLTPILRQVAVMRAKDVRAKAREYGLDWNKEADRLTAAEEVLAEMAQANPQLSFVQRAVSAIRNWLRAHVPGFKSLRMTNQDMIQAFILPARGAVTRGSETTQQALERAMRGLGFSRDDGAAPSEAGNALAALSQVDELFQIPKSQGKSVEEIAADVDPAIKVRRAPGLPNRQDYKLTMANGKTVTMMVAPKGLSRYQFDYVDGQPTNELIERPGENPEDVPPGTGDVWIDVSALESGEGGREVYAIAANFAHNNGMIFIGDPAGLSDDAMLRRPEQMLSSALKFGTTAHLAPHPRQVSGDKSLGIPPLKWVYGDDLGNIRRLIDLNLKALDNAGYGDDSIRFDPADATFRDASDGEISRSGIEDLGSVGVGRRVRAGGTTLARRAILASLVRREGQAQRGADGRSDGLLEDLLRLANQSLPSVRGLFYSRSVAPATGESHAARRVGAALKSITVTDIKRQAAFKAADLRPLGLSVLGRMQLVEVYGDMLPELRTYSRLMERMDADKNEAAVGADKLAEDWAKLADERPLAELMHDATLAQMDPAKDYVAGDNRLQYGQLRKRFEALSPAAREVYTRARDTYGRHLQDVRSAIKERIERAEMNSERRAAMLKRLDDEFFGHTKGVYFPLARFGQYVVVVKGADGKVANVSRAETMAEADVVRRELLAAFPPAKGFSVGKVLKSKDFVAERDSVGRGFMEQLYGVLDKQGMDAKQRAELEDALGQLYLSSLPDLSWAKHGIHRKGTPGFSQDARRAFAQNVFHGASYLAKLRYADQLQDQLAEMQRRVDAGAGDANFDSVKAQQVMDEMAKRHDAAMNPKSNALSTALTSLGFIFHLGLSPASAMVNLSQTALVAYPIMGAKWGFQKAGAALLKASGEAARGRNDITASLSAEEKAAFDEAVRAGTVDVTMAHDLAGIAQGEDRAAANKLRPVMKWASFLFHHAEKFNRQVTFVAAYRLARESGADAQAAYEQATDATYKGHFNYSANNRPRAMQGNVAKVLLLFKQYSQNMVYTLARSAHQSLKGATPEARAEARKALGGLLTMHAMAAGVLGLPMVTTLLSAASMLGGDDDEPWDAQVALQNLLADTFGQKPAEVLAHGISRLTPWDVSGRVGLDRLIFPDVQEGLEGQRLGESAMAAALGPVAGIGINALKGLQLMGEGRYQLGLEAMAPSVLRGPLKAWRYETEGVKDKTGIVVQDEVDAASIWGQAAGFSPSTVRNAYEGKSAIVGYDRALQARLSSLVERFAMAAMAGDEEGKAEAREAIAKFNEKNPARRINPMQLAQSVRMREKRIRDARDGVYLPSKRRDAVEHGRFAVEGAPV